MRVLITGGAGFVGSALARLWRESEPGAEIVAFDNLMRRGSELNVTAFQREGIAFIHGDVRCPEDLEAIPGTFDVVIDAAAEPSVTAGLEGSPFRVLQTNLAGTLHTLEFARRRGGAFVFLSTSRVYSLDALRGIRTEEQPSRLAIAARQDLPGVGPAGISEQFPTRSARSFYGASKLAAELVVQEYAHSYGLRAVIDRCGVLAGPGQFGKSDQGVYTYWVLSHHFGKPLRYTGFGGTGKQVRDLLHPRDLYALLRKQLDALRPGPVEPLNVGGGPAISVSLRELTELCREVVGREVPISGVPDSSSVDVPIYVSDCAVASARHSWRPETDARAIVREIHEWIRRNEAELRERLV